MVSTPLTSLFGEHPEVRILEFLAGHRGFDYTITQISRNAGVSRPAAYKVVDHFLANGVIARTRRVGASTFYRLEEDHALVRPFLEAELVHGSGNDAAPRTRAGSKTGVRHR